VPITESDVKKMTLIWGLTKEGEITLKATLIRMEKLVVTN
jgi:hypothetical protein